MPNYRLSDLAARDLEAVYIYTALQFGRAHTTRYKQQLEAAMGLLAAYPAMGRQVADLRGNVHRHEHGMHIIFYTLDSSGILITRILSSRSNWMEHL